MVFSLPWDNVATEKVTSNRKSEFYCLIVDSIYLFFLFPLPRIFGVDLLTKPSFSIKSTDVYQKKKGNILQLFTLKIFNDNNKKAKYIQKKNVPSLGLFLYYFSFVKKNYFGLYAMI